MWSFTCIGHLQSGLLQFKNKLYVCFLSVPVLAQSTIRWCTISNAEHKKCEAMSQAFASASIRPSVSCVNGLTVEGCFQKLQVGFGFLLMDLGLS